MKVLYDGSFNPLTIDHLKVYEVLIGKFNIKEIIFMPTANFYEKPDLVLILKKLICLKIICFGLKKVVVSEIELNMTEYKTTSFTFECFSGYYFLMSADNFSYIEKWINYSNFIFNNKFIISGDGFDFENKFNLDIYLTKYRDNFIILDDLYEIGLRSSDFRQSFNKNSVTKEDFDYILNNNKNKVNIFSSFFIQGVFYEQ